MLALSRLVTVCCMSEQSASLAASFPPTYWVSPCRAGCLCYPSSVVSFPRSQQLLWNLLLFSLSNIWTTAFYQLLHFFHGVSGCLSSLCSKEHYAFPPCSWSDHTFGFSLIIHYMASPFHLQKALSSLLLQSGLLMLRAAMSLSTQKLLFTTSLDQCLLNFVSFSFLLSFLD